VGLIITPLLLLLLWDEVENLVQNFQSAKQVINLADTQEPLSAENVNRPTFNMHHVTKELEDNQSWRRVYPYSVVDGGVHSIQELRSAIWRDPVVAKHYSNFKLDSARVIEAKAGRDFHVSYRIGDEIFWTKKRLKVAKSEKLITDGTTFTRTRCANVLSEVLPGKTSPVEPTPEVFDTPTLPPSDPAPFIPPVTTGEGSPAPALPPSGPTLIIAGGGPLNPGGGGRDIGGDGDGEGNPSAPLPEPTTLLLLVFGLLGLAGYGRRKFFKK
jgi:hypothetical protein